MKRQGGKNSESSHGFLKKLRRCTVWSSLQVLLIAGGKGKYHAGRCQKRGRFLLQWYCCSEILRSPVEVASLSQYLRSFYIPGGAGFLNHQQYTTVKLSVNDTSLSKKFGQRRPEGEPCGVHNPLSNIIGARGFSHHKSTAPLSKGTSNGRWSVQP